MRRWPNNRLPSRLTFIALAFARVELGRDLIDLGKFREAEAELLEAEQHSLNGNRVLSRRHPCADSAVFDLEPGRARKRL